jgi:hypothetical protein
MAFILVLTLLKSKAYSFDDCQIVLLHVQSKRRPSKAALQPLHGFGHTFFIFFSMFRRAGPGCVVFLRQSVEFCKCEMTRRIGGILPKAIGGCSLFVLALVAGRKTGTRCGS